MNAPFDPPTALSDTLTSHAGQSYCLTPINMVPNGPPHLGHVSGPLLRMDILRRYLLRQGAEATFVTTTDAHETHVVVKARELGLTPEETANRFHAQITADLASLDIAYDALINPLDPQWAPVYSDVTRALMDALDQAGACTVMTETLPLRADDQSYVLGGWLAGNCPNCGAGLVSFFCENCGDQTTPSKLKNPHHRIDDVALTWRDDRSLFLKLPSDQPLTAQLDRMGIRRDFREIADRYLAKEGPVFRLSLPDPWGEPCRYPGLPEGHVTFSYSLALAAAQLLSGEVYKSLTGKDENPFLAGSDVIIVSSFGIDNAVPMLIGVLGVGVGQEVFRPPDYYLCNFFYTLAGEKFSTNRQHAIWAADICQKSALSTDLFRAYMVRANPEFALSDFDPDDFVTASNALIRDTTVSVQAAFAHLADAPPAVPDDIPGHLARRLQQALARQQTAMDLRDFCLLDMVSPIESWVKARPALCGSAALHNYWWAKGLALLSWPVMPKFGTWVWQELGHSGDPTGQDFAKTPPLAISGADTPLGGPIDRDALNAVLPAALRT